MKTILASMLLTLSCLSATAGESAPTPLTVAQAAPLQTPAQLAPARVIPTRATTAQLAAEIFAGTESFSGWGSCSFSCDWCLLGAWPNGGDCPLDMYGRPQSCLPECP
jgi:hypothetical protein